MTRAGQNALRLICIQDCVIQVTLATL